MTSAPFGSHPVGMTSAPFGESMGTGPPESPCCPGAGARPPPEVSPGAWSPGAEPGALEVWGGGMGRSEQCGQSRRTLSKRVGPGEESYLGSERGAQCLMQQGRPGAGPATSYRREECDRHRPPPPESPAQGSGRARAAGSRPRAPRRAGCARLPRAGGRPRWLPLST